MNDVTLRIRIDDESSLASVLDLASGVDDLTAEIVSSESADGDLEPQIAPVVAVLIGAGVIVVARFVYNWWDKVRGGLVIDQRPDAIDMIYRDRDVPWGIILVFPADGGSVKVDTKDEPKDAIERWIGAVISGTFGSLRGVADSANKVTGGPKVETE